MIGSKINFIAMISFFVMSYIVFQTNETNETIKNKTVAKSIPVDTKIDYVAEISFPLGKDIVPINAKDEIRRLFNRAQKKGQIESVKIFTWADKEFLSSEKKRFGSEQLLLVEHRNDNLEAYMENFNLNFSVDKISMAERPGVMERILSSDDIKLKKSFEGLEVRDKASKSIVLIVFEE